MRNLFALLWLTMGVGWGHWLHRRLLDRGRTSTARRFLANWLGVTCYLLGLAGVMVLANDGWHRARGPGAGWQRWHWTEAIAFALALGLIAGAVGTWQGWGRRDERHLAPELPAFPDTYVKEILDAERQASPEECLRMANRLVRDARRTQQGLPPALLAFVNRHQPRRHRVRGG